MSDEEKKVFNNQVLALGSIDFLHSSNRQTVSFNRLNIPFLFCQLFLLKHLINFNLFLSIKLFVYTPCLSMLSSITLAFCLLFLFLALFKVSFCLFRGANQCSVQGTLTEGKGPVQLTSSSS